MTTKVGIYRFIVHSQEHGIMRKPGTGKPTKICGEIKLLVEQTMLGNDETTAHQLHALLVGAGYSIPLPIILRCRASLGWTFRGSANCQLIIDANKVLRHDWAVAHQDDAVWNEPCTTTWYTRMRPASICCRKKGQAPKPKPKPKHPLKVHVWAGISRSGATGVCTFEGIMDRHLYNYRYFWIKLSNLLYKRYIQVGTG